MVQLRRSVAAGAAVWLLLAGNPAAALDKKPDYIIGGIGLLDTTEGRDSGSGGLDWRLGVRYWLSDEPSVGGMTITDRRGSDRTALSQGGVGLELTLGDGFIFTPSIAAGLSRSGDPTDPTSSIEIRAGLEAAYEFSNDWRIGAGFYHIGPTGSGAEPKDGRSEVLTFTLSVPFGAR